MTHYWFHLKVKTISLVSGTEPRFFGDAPFCSNSSTCLAARWMR